MTETQTDIATVDMGAITAITDYAARRSACRRVALSLRPYIREQILDLVYPDSIEEILIQILFSLQQMMLNRGTTPSEALATIIDRERKSSVAAWIK